MRTKQKSITMLDIAKYCNVSIATVSYVLNGRDDERISNETKQKILQIANLYQYRLNPYAKALATGKTQNILLFYEDSDFMLYKAEILDFIDAFASLLKKQSCNLAVAPKSKIATYKYVDAIITYRISKKIFKELANVNYVPIISIDCQINDDIFFEISDNFNLLKNDEEILYLSLKYNDEEINNLIADKCHVKFIESFDDLNDVINYPNKLISLNKSIYDFLKLKGVECECINLNTDDKLNLILETIDKATSRENVTNHKLVI